MKLKKHTQRKGADRARSSVRRLNSTTDCFIGEGRFVSLAPNFHYNHQRRSRHRRRSLNVVVVARTSTNDVKNTFQVVDLIANMNELRH